MAVNLVSLVTQFLTPDVIARIASTLGLESTTVQKAISGSIPAILAGLAGVAVKPEGAQQLSGAVAQQSPTVLDNLTSVIGGAGQRAFADGGSSMLSKLLGGGTMNALTGAIGEFAGVSKTATGSLLGMLGPVVLGALGRQQRSAGLDASGLASLLASQKDQIAAAIPSGLANQLGGTGLLDMVDKRYAQKCRRRRQARQRGGAHHRRRGSERLSDGQCGRRARRQRGLRILAAGAPGHRRARRPRLVFFPERQR